MSYEERPTPLCRGAEHADGFCQYCGIFYSAKYYPQLDTLDIPWQTGASIVVCTTHNYAGKSCPQCNTRTKPITIGVDFDGVCHAYDPKHSEKIPFGPPIEGIFDFLEWCDSQGHKYFIFTTRAQTELGLVSVEEWFRHHRGWAPQITNKKLLADLYIDDRGFRFTGDFEAVKQLIAAGVLPWDRKPVSKNEY